MLKREGARKNDRWVVTPKFAGCGADGQAILDEEMELDPSLYVKLQKIADARGVSVEIAMSQILQEEVDR